MLFAIICTDRPGRIARRQELRPSHLDYVDRFKENIVTAGPLLAQDGETSVGGLLIVDFPDSAAAEAFIEGAPYSCGGLFEAVVVRPWRRVLPTDSP